MLNGWPLIKHLNHPLLRIRGHPKTGGGNNVRVRGKERMLSKDIFRTLIDDCTLELEEIVIIAEKLPKVGPTNILSWGLEVLKRPC